LLSLMAKAAALVANEARKDSYQFTSGEEKE
jgi:hypothetical protein